MVQIGIQIIDYLIASKSDKIFNINMLYGILMKIHIYASINAHTYVVIRIPLTSLNKIQIYTQQTFVSLIILIEMYKALHIKI